MSVDDDDPRHLQVARALQHENEQAWIRERHRCDNLVRDNDQLRADLATVTAERERIHREADQLRQGHQTLVASQADDRQRLATERAARETTEAQLAAVRDVCLRACPDGRSSVHISTADLWPLLSPRFRAAARCGPVLMAKPNSPGGPHKL